MHATEPKIRLYRSKYIKNRDLYKVSCVDRQYRPSFRKVIAESYERNICLRSFRAIRLNQRSGIYMPLSLYKNHHDYYDESIYSWGQRKIIKRILNKRRR